jgi:hypothetical protein
MNSDLGLVLSQNLFFRIMVDPTPTTQMAIYLIINQFVRMIAPRHQTWNPDDGEDSHKFSSERGDKPPLRAQP